MSKHNELSDRVRFRRFVRKIMVVLGSAILIVGIGWGSFLAYSAGSHNGLYREEGPIELTAPNSVVGAVEVLQLENKFVEVRRIGIFGGGAAGGLGAPQIFAKSAQQFVSLVAVGEPIYTTTEFDYYDGYRSRKQFKVTYWAFIENRAGMVVFEEFSSRPPAEYGWEFESFDENTQTATYINDNADELGGRAFRYIVLSLIVGGWILNYATSPYGHKLRDNPNWRRNRYPYY